MRRTGLALLLALWATAAGAELTLGAGDSVKVTVKDRADLSGSYAVNPDGRFRIPGLGQVTAAGETLAGVEAAVQGLAERELGLSGPVVAVAIDRLRPVMVGGAVARPGELGWQHGMLVAHAVAGAGGRRNLATSEALAAIEIGREQDRLDRSRDELAAALVLAARLTAELDHRMPEAAPEAAIRLVGAARAEQLLGSERGLAAAREESHRMALKSADDLKVINVDDVKAQESIADSLQRQLALIRKELDTLAPVAERGNVTGARMLDLRRDLVEVEGKVGESIASLSKARTEGVILAGQQLLIELNRRLEILTELTAASNEIVRNEATVRSIESALAASGNGRFDADTVAPPCRFVLLRRAAAGPVTLPADWLSEVLPGDLVLVGSSGPQCPPFGTPGP